MVTKVNKTNLGEVSINQNGSSPRKEFWVKEEDVVANGNGTYTVATTEPASDADIAVTKDTKRIFVYDEDIKAWWKW